MLQCDCSRFGRRLNGLRLQILQLLRQGNNLALVTFNSGQKSVIVPLSFLQLIIEFLFSD